VNNFDRSRSLTGKWLTRNHRMINVGVLGVFGILLLVIGLIGIFG